MASPQRDYYEVLGVPRDADLDTIKRAFRSDRNKEPDAEERFKEIAEAYAVLSDSEKRAQYDARGFPGVAGFSPEDLFGGMDLGDLFRGTRFDLGFDFGEGLFEQFFGRRRPRRTQGANIEVDLSIPLEKVLEGGAKTVRVARSVECTSCHGSGAKPGTTPRACPACGGTGQQSRGWRERGVSMQRVTVCGECRGAGKVERSESISVSIPVGVEEGMALRVPGKGYDSPEPGGAPGDL